MKKVINIKIPDNLSDKDELIAIGKKLTQKHLSGGGDNKSVKRLGGGVDVKEITTTIVIERVSAEKPIELLKCNVCGCEYRSDMAKYYHHNYGGKRQRRSVCSDNCVQFMIENFGVRVQKTARKLPHPIDYFRRQDIRVP